VIVVAIDPGDHMGWCVGTTEGEPYAAGTDTPAQFFLRLETWVGSAVDAPCSVDQVVFEAYTVEDPAANQGTDVPTLQYIGIIKYICARAAVPCEPQSRQVKGAARSKLKHMGVKPLPGDGHAKDAQLHWWAWVWRH
jgi:hypothetical protein